jgi:hypothetical protein
MDPVDSLLSDLRSIKPTNTIFIVTVSGDYKRKHGHFPMGVKKWVFRIGYIRGLETAEQYGIPEPMEFKAAEDIAKVVAVKLGLPYIYVEP